MKYFGTDGIRDRISGPLLESQFVTRLGLAVGQWLNRKPATSAPHVAIGRDTRSSGGYLFLAIARGLAKEGVRIFDAGVCPTPAVASTVRMLGLDMGIVITASHNPATDNGIKLFGHGGCKLRPEEEEEIESILEKIPPREEDISKAPSVRYFEARRHYLEIFNRLIPERALLGLRVVIDCANGSTYRTSGEMLNRLGAQVLSIGCNPDGLNINRDVGSEYPEVAAKSVIEYSADLGICHDGDGDRVILCDHQGAILDGDAVLAILGTGWADRDRLPRRTVVSTIMSNLGLDHCLESRNIQLRRVGVGDRQVFYEMKKGGYSLGGESSGHFIAMEYLPTGDGLLAALLVLREMLKTGKTLRELASIFVPFPQLKLNLNVRRKIPLEKLEGLQGELAGLREKLGKKGRILLRYSGTEPKIRLLSEAENPDLCQSALNELQEIVKTYLPVD